MRYKDRVGLFMLRYLIKILMSPIEKIYWLEIVIHDTIVKSEKESVF